MQIKFTLNLILKMQNLYFTLNWVGRNVVIAVVGAVGDEGLAAVPGGGHPPLHRHRHHDHVAGVRPLLQGHLRPPPLCKYWMVKGIIMTNWQVFDPFFRDTVFMVRRGHHDHLAGVQPLLQGHLRPPPLCKYWIVKGVILTNWQVFNPFFRDTVFMVRRGHHDHLAGVRPLLQGHLRPPPLCTVSVYGLGGSGGIPYFSFCCLKIF